MFRKRKSKKTDEQLKAALLDMREARDVSIRERMEHRDAHGPTPKGHEPSEYDGELEHEELEDHEFTEELRNLLDEETGEIQEGERAFNVAGNDEARPATEDEAADRVNMIWLPRLGDDPEGALDDLQARVKQLGYRLAYAGRTHGAPVIKRTYYIIDTDRREPIEAFEDGNVDLTLLDVCLWSELAFKKWKNS
jgi:hypothetical protein